MKTWARRTGALALAVACAGSCRTAAGEQRAPIVQPGAPGESSRAIDARTAADVSAVQFTAADARFMQGMIAHHQQAVDMVALVPSRAATDGLRKLALRIDTSQVDEIKMMQEWLRARGQAVPGAHAAHGHAAALMPGMLTAEEMDRLAASHGVDFDRLFLQGMITHHAGALTMVQELFATPGAGQDSEIYAFASDVDADQRMEIDRMSAMLQELGK